MSLEADEKGSHRSVPTVAEEPLGTTLSFHEPHADATAIPDNLVANKWQRYANNFVQFIGAEARGVERIDESLRTAKMTLGDYYNMASIWFSVNLTVASYLPASAHHQWRKLY
jgi:hypothetical protein